jgi:hypothetical protein
MNNRDSSGFSAGNLEIDQDIIRRDGFVLLEYPRCDLREWMIVGTRRTMAFIHQYGRGRFQVLFPSNLLPEEPTSAFTHLDDAMRAVEFARAVQAACSICSGVKQ